MSNPSINQSVLIANMTSDLNAIRDEVAKAARDCRHSDDLDHASYRAYLTQAADLRSVMKQINGLWTDSYAKVAREIDETPSIEAVEARYSSILAKFLDDHLEETWAKFDGRPGERDIRNTKPAFEAEVFVRAASRHHASLIMYVDHYGTRLRARESDLTPALTLAL